MNRLAKLGCFLRRYLAAQQSHRAAVYLARVMWERGYRDRAPHWQPLGDTVGVISQIDNMLAGLRAETERLRMDAANSDIALKLMVKELKKSKAETKYFRARGRAQRKGPIA